MSNNKIFDTLIKGNPFITNSTLKSTLDRDIFNAKYREFTLTLYTHLNFHIDEIFLYYNVSNNIPLSETIFNLIDKALHLAAQKENTVFHGADGKATMQLSNKKSLASLASLASQIREFRTYLSSRYRGNNNLKPIKKIAGANRNTLILNALIDKNIFHLYNYILEIETSNYDTTYNNRVKLLSEYVNRYYFLSVLLLSLLLDTKGNVTIDNTSNELIKDSDIDTIGIGLYKPHKWTNTFFITKFTQCKNNDIPRRIKNMMRDKLLKDIYNVITNINQDSDIIIKKQLDFANIKEIISTENNKISGLEKNSDRYKTVINTLKAKDDSINRNTPFYNALANILFWFTILYILANIGALLGERNLGTLLVINLVVFALVLAYKTVDLLLED